MIINILLYSFLDSTFLPVLFFIGGAILLGLLFSGLFYWLDGNGFKLNKFSTQYQKLNDNKRLYLKVFIGAMMFWGLNYIPYYDLSNSNILVYKSIFETYPYQFYIHKTFFALPIIVGFLGSFFILWSDEIFKRVLSRNFSYNLRFYHILFGVIILTYLGVLVKDVSSIYEYREVQIEQTLKAARQKVINDSLARLYENISRYNDSITVVNENYRLRKRNESEKKYCSEKIAVGYFKSWLKKMHPQIKLIKIVEIWDRESCKYGITCIVNSTKHDFYDNDTLIVEMNINADGDFKQYSIKILTEPYWF